jgi:hypothetical protein
MPVQKMARKKPLRVIIVFQPFPFLYFLKQKTILNLEMIITYCLNKQKKDIMRFHTLWAERRLSKNI